MSYFDTPRLHFSGKFFTDPSTINNDPTHYDPDCITPSPWQDPNGQHRFQFRECLIRSVVDTNGPVSSDPVIGSGVTTTDQPDPARIVDIDVYQQGVSTIYGLQIKIILSDGTSLLGTMDPASLNDCWFNAVIPTRSWNPSDYDQDSFGGDMNACGYFMSVLRCNLADWPQTSSAVLNKLRSITLQSNNQYLLSIKFTMDGYENVPLDANYQLGRITGSIGPVFANEPLYNPGQRWMMPRAFSDTDQWNFPSFFNCPFKVDATRKKLVIDLANSICRQSAGGPSVNLGTLTATVVTPDPVVVQLGTVDYSAFAYDNNAQMAELDIDEGIIQTLKKGSLHLTMSRTDIGNPAVLTEQPPIPQFAVEVRPIRMVGTPGTSATTRVYVSQNGEALAGKQLAVFVESVHGNTPGATVPPTNPGDTPQADGALTATITTSDANGFAVVTLNVVKDPGYRTVELDGQLYFVIVYDPTQPSVDWSKVTPAQNQMISCLVWSQYTVNQNPTWTEIQAMMAPYMKLYPSMSNQLNLTDEHTFSIFSYNPPWSRVYNDPRIGPLGIVAGAIPYYMSVEFNDPRFMPITRDLSPAKILTIMHYVKNLQANPPSINPNTSIS